MGIAAGLTLDRVIFLTSQSNQLPREHTVSMSAKELVKKLVIFFPPEREREGKKFVVRGQPAVTRSRDSNTCLSSSSTCTKNSGVNYKQ